MFARSPLASPSLKQAFAHAYAFPLSGPPSPTLHSAARHMYSPLPSPTLHSPTTPHSPKMPSSSMNILSSPTFAGTSQHLPAYPFPMTAKTMTLKLVKPTRSKATRGCMQVESRLNVAVKPAMSVEGSVRKHRTNRPKLSVAFDPAPPAVIENNTALELTEAFATFGIQEPTVLRPVKGRRATPYREKDNWLESDEEVDL